jgi:hypothetical protein
VQQNIFCKPRSLNIHAIVLFLESDANKDRLISYDEFLTETKKDEFEEDPGWETMDMQVNIFYRTMFCLLAALIYI